MIPRPLPKSISHSVEDLVPFAKIRLIIADVDGTLLGPEKQIWSNILRLKNSMTHYQVRLTIATGRTLSGMEDVLSVLKIRRGTPIIFYNGSIVVLNGTFKTLAKKIIPLESLKQLLNLIDGQPVQILAYFYNELSPKMQRNPFSFRDSEFVLGWSEIDCPEREFNGMRVKWLNWGECPVFSSPSAILVNTKSEGMSEYLLENVLNKISGVAVIRSGKEYLELRPIGSDKGKAMEKICTFLRYKSEEVLAIGDNDNDAELLSSASIGVAVKNSSNKAVQNSDYISEYDFTGGVIQALRLVRDARRYAEDKSFRRRVYEADNDIE